MNKKQVFLTSLLFLATSSGAYAGPNDFFGGPGNTPDPNAIGSPLSSPAPSAPSGDFSSDEKRMQKRYQANLRHAHDLVKEGEDMKVRGEKKHDDKMAKKGKILLEIGQKQLTELQANNPYPSLRRNDNSTK